MSESQTGPPSVVGTRWTEVRVAVVGNVDSGKSTLVGVLSKGELDDGRGNMRKLVFNFAHEKSTGRTTSIAHEIMGFRDSGEQVLPLRLTEPESTMWERIITESSRVVSFLDLCGHEKYLKTTILGLMGLMPDYTLLVVGANSGFTVMAREHLGLSLALKIPIIVVITKVDMDRESVYQETLGKLQRLFKTPGAGSQLAFVVKDEDNIGNLVASMEARVTPIFSVSNVTGQGMNQLKEFLRLLPPRGLQKGLFGRADQPTEMLIDSVYMVKGIGMVVAGLLKAGTVRPGQVLLFGPDSNGVFKPVTVRGIHFNRVQVELGTPGQSICLAITSQTRGDKLNKNSFRRGMLLVERNSRPRPVWEFDAEVVVLHHSTTIRRGYEPVVHIGVVEQTAKVVEMSREPMCTKDKGLIRFKFTHSPEIVTPGATVLFREAKTKGFGTVSSVFYADDPLPQS